jgi:hypothetical protein
MAGVLLLVSTGHSAGGHRWGLGRSWQQRISDLLYRQVGPRVGCRLAEGTEPGRDDKARAVLAICPTEYQFPITGWPQLVDLAGDDRNDSSALAVRWRSKILPKFPGVSHWVEWVAKSNSWCSGITCFRNARTYVLNATKSARYI